MELILRTGEHIYDAKVEPHGPAETFVSAVKSGFLDKSEDLQVVENEKFHIYEESVSNDDFEFSFFRKNNKYYVKAYEDTFVFESLEKSDIFDLLKGPPPKGGELIYPPMPGSVVAVLKQNGDFVNKGDKIMVIEAMKMETTLVADTDGLVTRINLNIGDRFDTDTVLFSVDPEKGK